MAAVQEQRGEQATGAEARAGSPSLLDRVKQAVGLGGTEEAAEPATTITERGEMVTAGARAEEAGGTRAAVAEERLVEERPAAVKGGPAGIGGNGGGAPAPPKTPSAAAGLPPAGALSPTQAPLMAPGPMAPVEAPPPRATPAVTTPSPTPARAAAAAPSPVAAPPPAVAPLPVAVPLSPVAAPLPAGVAPSAAAAARLEERGARRGRVGEGAAVVSGAAAGEAGAPTEAQLPEPSKGGCISVQRLGAAGGPARAAVPGGVATVEARPGFEVVPPSAAEVAGMKASEMGIKADERQREAEAKREELHALRHQTELLEIQSQGLLAEASQEKMRRDQTREQKQVWEQEEWHGYVHAEQAERERREVVLAARPAAAKAEDTEFEALRVRQLAADTHFHAEVLERRAASLTKESTDMARLAYERDLEAERLAAAVLVKRQEQEEWQEKVNAVSSGDLPHYIQECQAEMGRLSRRMQELREEVDWARMEIDRLRSEGRTWERVLQTKKSEAALLRLRMEQARQEAEEARERARQAAFESEEPNRLAETKYEEAVMLKQRADALEAEAQAAQARVLEVVRQAVGPEQTRQEHLRQAADAELRAKQLEAEAQLIEGKMERRLVEAETRAETATVLAQRAQVVDREGRAAEMTAQAQREMAGGMVESKERAEVEAARRTRVMGAPPVTPEVGEAVRRQRERHSGATVLPTVPVEAPAVRVDAQENPLFEEAHAVPAAPGPAVLSSTEVEAMLAEAPPAPTHPATAVQTSAQRREDAAWERQAWLEAAQ
ncbi:hypothetical protein C2E20_7270 [Micractinium conductrix]|uniref:Uncharacterized protein n=1 Tax=Micractinium conductrix TaxID=554055 RepID=A0A2P6V543_9CHLO|nr:hypothetical protein C2E20_7270 [Micractinium conductrix]|eukprot:PSC69205.1 hypothetical protein C2E20_7270 [Micractinium conductrix]